MNAKTPTYPTGHDMLADRTVVVTAAAGTGIGFAAAKRCIEEGAIVMISDLHERRLGEAAERLAEVAGAPVASCLCNVTKQDEVDGLFEA
ncbi:MAG: SDR family oxidoreductase, partial [Candidatus Binatia bacterium]